MLPTLLLAVGLVVVDRPGGEPAAVAVQDPTAEQCQPLNLLNGSFETPDITSVQQIRPPRPAGFGWQTTDSQNSVEV